MKHGLTKSCEYKPCSESAPRGGRHPLPDPARGRGGTKLRVTEAFLAALLAAVPVSGQVFPSAVATDADLLVAANSASSKIDGAINDSVQTFAVTSASTFANNMVVVIDSEQIFCTTFSGLTFSGCTRGYDSTTPASHNNGAQVRNLAVAAYHNNVAAEIKAIEQQLGASMGNVARGTGLLENGAVSFVNSPGQLTSDIDHLRWHPSVHLLCVNCDSWETGYHHLQVESAASEPLYVRFQAITEDDTAALEIHSGGGLGHAFLEFGKGAGGSSDTEWVVAGIWNGYSDFQIIDPDDGYVPRLYIGKSTKQVVIPTTNDKGLWLHNDDGSLNTDLYLGRFTDSAEGLYAISTDDSSGDTLLIRSMRYGINAVWAQSAPGDVIQQNMRLDASSGNSTILSVISQAGEEVAVRLSTSDANGEVTSPCWYLAQSAAGEFSIATCSAPGAGNVFYSEPGHGYAAIGIGNQTSGDTLLIKAAGTTGYGATSVNIQAGGDQVTPGTEYHLVRLTENSAGLTQIGLSIADYGNAVSLYGTTSHAREAILASTATGGYLGLSGNSDVRWTSGAGWDEGTQDTLLSRQQQGTLKIADDSTGAIFLDSTNLRIALGGLGASNVAISQTDSGILDVEAADSSNWAAIRARSIDLLDTSTGQQVSVRLLDNTTEKWILRKETGNQFSLYDSANSRNMLRGASGTLYLQPDGGNVDLAGSSAVVVATGSIDFSASTAFGKPWKAGTGAPSASACDSSGEVGRVYFRTDAGVMNASVYVCSNTAASEYQWEVLGSGSGGAGAGSGAITQSFASNTTWTFTDDLGTCYIAVEAWVDVGSTWQREVPTTIGCNESTYEIVLTWSESVAGYAMATAGGGAGGGSPGGVSSELQYRSGASTFGAVSGTIVTGSQISMTGKLELGGGTLEIPNSASLPGTCVTGEVYIDTDAASGENVFACISSAWVQQIGAGGSGPAGSGTELQYKNGSVFAAWTGTSVAGSTLTVGSGGWIDLSAAHLRPPYDPTLPTTCTVNEVFIDSDATPAGSRFFICTATNTWTVQGGGAPGGSNTQMQYNAAGAFGGLSGFTTDGSSLSLSIPVTTTSTVTVSTGGSLIATVGNIMLPKSNEPPPLDCNDSSEAGRIYYDANATSGQRLFVCEGTEWKLQGDGGTGGGGGGFDASTSYDLSGLNTVNVATVTFERTNSGTGGTTVNRTVCIDSSGEAVMCTTSTGVRAIGVCLSGCGTTSSARIAVMGVLSCDADGAVTAGNWVTYSSSTSGKCTDAGSSKPTYPLGIWLETAGAAGLREFAKGLQ